MIKTIALLTILSLRMAYQPDPSRTGMPPFASHTATVTEFTPVKILSIEGSISDKKAVLEWEVDDNDKAYLFEVEKSADGIQYSLAAVVFGTDRPERDRYRFYEKPGKGKWMYRVKLVGKNHEAAYSPVIALTPKA